MKKVLIAALAMIMAASAHAQIVSSSSRSIIAAQRTTVVEHTTVSYVKAGISFNNAIDGTSATKATVGYNFVYGFQKTFSDIGLYWGMETGLGTRGWKSSEIGYTIRMLHHTIKASPLQFGFKIDPIDNLTVDVHIGAYASFDFAGNIKENDEGDIEKASLSDYTDNVNRYDFGINPGASLWYGNFGIDITWQRGFVNIFKSTKSPSSNFILSLAYRF